MTEHRAPDDAGEILSGEDLAAIEHQIRLRRYAVRQESIQAAVDRRLLFFHARALAARLAEAERTIQNLEGQESALHAELAAAQATIAEERAKWREAVLNIGNERDDLFDKVAAERERRVDGLYAHEDYLSSCDCPICTITRRLDVALATPASDRAGGTDGK